MGKTGQQEIRLTQAEIRVIQQMRELHLRYKGKPYVVIVQVTDGIARVWQGVPAGTMPMGESVCSVD